jgi:serine/threonine protein kinase/WD40 repeat protein/Flp pilus assembly protein TadD
MSGSESGPDRDPLERLAEEFAARLRRGEHPAISEYEQKYPELADDIRELFPALALVENFKPERPELEGSATGPAAPDGRQIPERLGEYRILRYIGEGGMGVVYEAVHESLSSPVALKVMHAQYRKSENYLRRFRREARSAARLHHTNIVNVFDYGVHEGVCYYAMRYVPGQSLDKVLADLRRLRREQEQAPGSGTAGSGPSAEDVAEDGENGPKGRSVPSTEPLARSVMTGLLTGQWPSEPTSDGTKSEDPSSELNDPDATGSEVDQEEGTNVLTLRRAAREATTLGSTVRPSNVRAHRFGFGLGQTGSVTSAESEPPVAPVESRADEQDASHGSTSTLGGKGDSRYHREVARLCAQVAGALAYAHERKVLHRDIKPSNLILDGLGNLWVTDFGLAKLDDGDDISRSGVLGTFRYMAPERFKGVSDPRGDVYALGATLYELMTLRPAFEGKDQLELIRRIEHDPPVRPREHDPRISRDLETIILKALAKDPADRFASAAEMAEDLHCFIANRPTRSRPIPAYKRFWRWCEREPWLAGANIAAAVLTTILAIVMSIAAKIYYDKSRENAEQASKVERSDNQSRERLFESRVSEARARRYSRQVGQRFEGLKALHEAADIGHALKLPHERFNQLRDEAIACMALPDMEPAGPAIHEPAGANGFAVDAGMTRYAVHFHDGTILVRRTSDDEELARFKPTGDLVSLAFALSPDGRYLSYSDGPRKAAVVRDVERKSEVLCDARKDTPEVTCFSPDSRAIAIGHSDGSVAIYDLMLAPAPRLWPGPSHVRFIAFRPDGREIAVAHGGARPTCRILNVDTGQQVREFAHASGGVVAWSPDGKTVAIAGDDSKISIYVAATGERGGVVEEPIHGGLCVGFHPSGSLLASNGWGQRLRLWDVVHGRLMLSLTTGYDIPRFSRDGRILVQRGEQRRPWRVEPALEYLPLVHGSSRPLNYQRPSIHREGRILAVGTDQGVVLWDLETRTELEILPIGLAWHSAFSVIGDLLTNGLAGVLRWPVRVDRTGGQVRLGPPIRLPLPGTNCAIDEDREGRTVVVAGHSAAYLVTDDRPFSIGPLEDCLGAYVSPGGEWLATGSFTATGVMIWKLPEATKVATLPTSRPTHAAFSPDGRWLATEEPCRLIEAGSWREVHRFDGRFKCFSPAGGLAVVVDASNVLLLVAIETGRILARFESPDQHPTGFVTFSPDGSRLVETSNDPPGAHVWDLRAIRRQLAEMGLDWDAPPFPPARSSTGEGDNPPLKLDTDFGFLKNVVENRKSHEAQNSVPAEELIARLNERLKTSPEDAESLHQRGHAFLRSGRPEDALADFTTASSRRPQDAHLRAYRGVSLFNLNRYALALDQLDEAVRMDPQSVRAITNLDQALNNVAWQMAGRDPLLAARMAAFAVALAPGDQTSLNTLGVAQYRASRFASAIETLQRSLAAGHGQFDAFDLFFLAMAHHRLGHRAEARPCFDRAVRWVSEQKALNPRHASELAAFRAEAESVLTGRAGEMPDDVFAEPGS